jgi:UDP-N-acetylglucosamine 2-epimerase (non-hydrolysing)
VTGNTVIDALLWILKKQSGPEEQKRMREYFPKTFGLANPHQRFILVTAHRRESFGEGFENICQAIKEIALRNPDVQIVYPVHLNPNVQEPVYRIIGGVERIHLIEPLEYEPFVYLMNQSFFILTDSGGIQEEAPSLGKPVLVMREVTERLKLWRQGRPGWSARKESIVRKLRNYWISKEYQRMASRKSLRRWQICRKNWQHPVRD